MRLQGTPYAPGWARGTLSDARAGSGEIALVPYDALGALSRAPAGLVVVEGPPLSHPMIRLFAWEVPVVIVTRDQAAFLTQGETLAIDGTTGTIGDMDSPPAGATPPPPTGPVVSRDGTAMALRASVASAEGARLARLQGATAIGLVRSEALLPEAGGQPDELFYEESLQRVCEAAHPLAVTVRLLDVAADKLPPWLPAQPGMRGALGMQGSRLFGTEPVRSVVRAQVSATARLARDYDLSLLLPYIVHPEEFQRWQRDAHLWGASAVAVGTMAETPAAALAMAEWKRLADFVAVGCNDLMQCLFAADRDVAEVAEVLDPYAPVLLRFLRDVAVAAGDRVADIQLCGLLPQVPGLLPVLMGMGYRCFSVEPHLIPTLARTVAQTEVEAATQRAHRLCQAPDASAVREELGLPPAMAWGLGAH